MVLKSAGSISKTKVSLHHGTLLVDVNKTFIKVFKTDKTNSKAWCAKSRTKSKNISHLTQRLMFLTCRKSKKSSS